MMRRRWWRATRTLTPSVGNTGRIQIRQYAEALRDGARDVISLTQQHDNAERSLIVPACQWAQNDTAVVSDSAHAFSTDDVSRAAHAHTAFRTHVTMLPSAAALAQAVAVRYSPKKHGPVSVANVDDTDVQLNATHLLFSALAKRSANSHRPLRFELNLELEGPIDPELSTWSAGTAGRLTLTLAKANSSLHHWARLAKPPTDGVRRGHISTWFEMAEHFRAGNGGYSSGGRGSSDDDDDDDVR